MNPRRPTVRDVIAAVCREFRVPPAAIASNGKDPNDLQARQACALLLLGLIGMSYPEITLAMGQRRSHSGTMERINNAIERASADPVFSERVCRIAAEFDGTIRASRDRWEFQHGRGWSVPHPLPYIADELRRYAAEVVRESPAWLGAESGSD